VYAYATPRVDTSLQITHNEVGADASHRAPSGCAMKPARSKGRLTIDAAGAFRERRWRLL